MTLKNGINWAFLCNIQGDRKSITEPEKYTIIKTGKKGMRSSRPNPPAIRKTCCLVRKSVIENTPKKAAIKIKLKLSIESKSCDDGQ